MSTAWEWSAQVRVLHKYTSTLVNTFSVKDEYTAPVGETPGYTTVTLFLARSENTYGASTAGTCTPCRRSALPISPGHPTCRNQSRGLPPIRSVPGYTAMSRSSPGSPRPMRCLERTRQRSPTGGPRPVAAVTNMVGGFVVGPNGRVP